tara:strand:- start:651 stop:884 length:234 start_codon:yes stop_codon:yes gene_type:complete
MFGLLSNNPMLLNILSQMPMQQQQQPTQIVEQPMLSATQGIGSSLPDYQTNPINSGTPFGQLMNLMQRMGIVIAKNE